MIGIEQNLQNKHGFKIVPFAPKSIMNGTRSNTFLVHTDSMFSRYGTVSKLRVAICISDEIWVPITTNEIIGHWGLIGGVQIIRASVILSFKRILPGHVIFF